MKYRLLDLLKDPATGGRFDIEIFETRTLTRRISFDRSQCRNWCHRNDENPGSVSPRDCERCYNLEIIDGILTAKESGEKFPIVGGIPRILPGKLWAAVLQERYSHYLTKYGNRFNIRADPVDPKKQATARTFGYQWTTFVDNFEYFKEIFLSFTKPFLDEKDFRGKLMFEIGCGSGRPAVTACRLGAEVVGMDISEAVETAFQKSLEEPSLHVVQADAYAPPFRPEFDVVYSVGVLQHIVSPKAALDGMFTVMSERSPLILWVYGKRELWYQPIEWLRSVTTRMPLRMLHGLSVLLALWSELFLLIPYRVLSKIPGCRDIADKIPGKIYARFPFKENAIGWFDRLGAPVTYYFAREEITELLKSAGFVDVEIASRKEASASWVVRARKRSAKTGASGNLSENSR